MFHKNTNKMPLNKATINLTGSWRFFLISGMLFALIWSPRAAAAAAATSEPVTTPNAVIQTGAGVQQATNQCFAVMGHSKIPKQIGAVWISPTNPCAIHACEMNEDTGRAYETITIEDCGQFYCDVDSEIRPKRDTCCGTCVRTRCRFNGTVYDIGQTWHNNEDCTLLECTQLANGEPMINAYQKTCPPLPPDCEPANIYTKDCCKYCKNRAAPRQSPDSSDELYSDGDDIWTKEFYANHPCVRQCQAHEPPKTCRYTFVVEWYETLSKACYNCPQNLTDCERPHCIFGDGIRRSVTIVNRMMPGPAIEVCLNDLIVVDVRNHLLGESTTIHWHGLHQKATPYMDGVPHISQCPISPHSTFRYTFKADNPGTHFWHSHTGMQRGDGVFGSLVIKRPRSDDPHAHLYDYDLMEHRMLVQDWVHVPGISMFASHHHSRGDNKPLNLLMNGRGRYYKAIWASIKGSARASATNTAMPPPEREAVGEGEMTTDPNEDYDVIQPLAGNGGRLVLKQPKSNEISRLARLVHPQENITKAAENTTESFSPLDSTTLYSEEDVVEDDEVHVKRTRRDIEDGVIALDEIPHEVFTVRHGFRYRFRIINAEFLNCPIQISIDNHTLLAINSDGYDFEAVAVGSIVTYAGERFDFIVDANQTAGNYWIRLKGLMDCSEKFTSAFQVAILRYDQVAAVEPTAELGYHHKPEGLELNAMNKGSGHKDSLTIAEVNALGAYDSVPGVDRHALKPVADYKFFVYYDFYAKDNPVFHPADYYGVAANVSAPNRVFTPQLNHISLKFPSIALLPAREGIDDSLFCNETSLAAKGVDCRKEFCHCHHVLQVPLNAIVELIVVDEGFMFDANHPFHLHGNAFRVVGLERLGSNVTIEMVKQLDKYNLLKRNLVRPPVKDTVTVPDGGYTILRFEAYNPGFWLFHCHIEFHAEIGMALIFKVGDNEQMQPVPKNFPTCHDYMPDPFANDADDHEEESSPTKKPDGNSANGFTSSRAVLLPLVLLLICRIFSII